MAMILNGYPSKRVNEFAQIQTSREANEDIYQNTNLHIHLATLTRWTFHANFRFYVACKLSSLDTIKITFICILTGKDLSGIRYTVNCC